jgi:uncharacterized membrane protein YfcA
MAASLELLVTALLTVIALLGLALAVTLVASLRDLARRARVDATGTPLWRPSAGSVGAGFVTTFFDTLGVGNFATLTGIYRATGMVPDELIPGTLNVGTSVAGAISGLLFIKLVPVEPATLLSMIVAAGLGAWLGAGVVARLPRYRIRLGMGTALLGAATIMLLTQLSLVPGGGEATGFHGPAFALAVGVNFLLGALMTLGIGLYAPCMILVSLLGLTPRAAFPIMMGSCALLCPLAGIRFVRAGRYHPGASVGQTLGGVPGLLIAAGLVTAVPLTTLRWIVLVVVLYAAITMIRAGRAERRELLAARVPALPATV